jgi:uncharacterized damage-inducible protein DinB
MSLLDEMLEAWRYSREGVIAELENLPEMRCNERPGGVQRSALDLANHIIESGWLMAGELSRADGDFQRKPYPALIAELNPERPATTRAEALAALRRSLEQGMRLLHGAGEERLMRPIRQFNGVPASRMSWWHHGIAHEEYHRGQLAIYARLFGITPALTKLYEGEPASA